MDATSKWRVTGSPGTAVGGKQSDQGTDDQMKREDCGRNGVSSSNSRCCGRAEVSESVTWDGRGLGTEGRGEAVGGPWGVGAAGRQGAGGEGTLGVPVVGPWSAPG